jgi:DNA repair protein RadC
MTELIADLPFDDRPRERMMLHGAATLSDAELLAIVLGTGTLGMNAIQLARELLRDGRSALAASPVSKLAKVFGIGPAKATRVSAAFELARRTTAEDDDRKLPPLFDVEALGRTLLKKFSDESQEKLGGVFLDTRHRVVFDQMIYAGTINNAFVSTREVIALALKHRAIGVVLFHNHPSGDWQPSADDIAFTTKMRDSLALCDLKLVDHLIVGATRFLSMREKGLL